MRETHTLGAKTREWMVRDTQCPGFSDASVFLAGISATDPRFNIVRHDPPHAILWACFAGEGLVWAGGQWHACLPGSAYVTPPRVPHAYRSRAGAPWEVCWVVYKAGPKCPIRIPAPLLIHLDPQPLHSAILGLYRESVAPADPTCLSAWCEVLQLYASRTLRESRGKDVLWPVWNRVVADLAYQWTVGEMAAIACISPEHFRRLCQQQLGCSPMQHVRRVRMRHAGALLVSTPQKIELIAETVGYDGRFSFSTAFKQCMGLSPAEYRNQRA